MSFKNLFVKEDKPAVVPPVQKEQKPAVAPVTTFSSFPQASAPISGDVDGFLEHLESKIRDSNQPGPDFLEFTDAIKALASMPLTEQQKYMATYPTYLSAGMTVDKLVSSAEKYKQVLSSEEKSFNEELTQSKQEGVDSLIQQAQTEQDAIAKLTQEIQERTLKMQKLQVDANTNGIKLQQQEAAFKQAMDAKMSEIDSHIRNIQTYLNGNVAK